ncbi:MAG: hypothetical protein H0U46_02400 [Actinobacteria bacterium]|nr:hypothetical protein [Actinomycetota bacterium]
MDPLDLNPATLAQKLAQMARRSERSYADSDPTGILQLDRAVTVPVEPTTAGTARAFAADEQEQALGDAFDAYMGVPVEERVRAFASADKDELHDPTSGLLRLEER